MAGVTHAFGMGGPFCILAGRTAGDCRALVTTQRIARIASGLIGNGAAGDVYPASY